MSKDLKPKEYAGKLIELHHQNVDFGTIHRRRFIGILASQLSMYKSPTKR
jgi:hypothetical protein